MPRRRATKNEASKRPAPALPEGDEGKDMDREKRKEKVVALMRDFRAEVDSRVRNLRASVNEMLNQIDLAYTMEMMNIPQRIRQMPLKEFLKTGGSFEESSTGKLLGDQLASILDEDSMSRKCVPLESIMESNFPETKTVHGTRRRQKAEGATAGPPLTTKRGRPLATPMSKFSLSAATPMITPKFDMRLYQTPALPMRAAKPGEVIISMEGSPVVNPATDLPINKTLLVPLKDDKVVVLDGSMDVSDIDISQVNPAFMKMCLELHTLKVKGGKLKPLTAPLK